MPTGAVRLEKGNAMIATLSAAQKECDQYRDSDGFCRRNCACSGLSFCANKPQHDEAAREAAEAGIKRYNIMTGACGDLYVIPLDDNGRLL